MNNSGLINDTNNIKINRIISSLIYFYEKIVPNKIISIYIIGSYANKTFIKNSDLDITVILSEDITDNDFDTLEEFTVNLNNISDIPLDISYYKLNDLQDKQRALPINVLIKNGSKHIFGQDIKKEIDLPDLKSYIKTSINKALYFISRVRSDYYNNGNYKYLKINDVINGNIKKLDFPDNTKQFFGYTSRTINDSEGNEIPITKELILINSLIATAILACKGIYVGDKDQSLIKYKENINDNWTENIELTYTFCREKYNYLIPEEILEQNKLIDICKKTLEFENYFLEFILNLKL